MTSSIFNSICLTSSAISLIGAAFILLSSRKSTRTTMLVAGLKLQQSFPLNETIKCLTVVDVLMTIGFFIRSVVWLMGYTPYPLFPSVNMRHTFCVGITMWIEFHCISSYMWNFTYALDILLAIHGKRRFKILWPIMNCLLPAMFASLGAFSIYYPSLSTCGGHNLHEVVNYLAYFLPMSLVIICNPILFYYTAKKVKSLITRQHGRYSIREQTIVQSAKAKFSMIMFVFIACWFPTIINAVLDAFESNESVRDAMWAMWVLKAIMNPLQALLNCIVFRGWPRRYCNCFSQTTTPQRLYSTNVHINAVMKPSNEGLETDQLLPQSINLYTS